MRVQFVDEMRLDTLDIADIDYIPQADELLDINGRMYIVTGRVFVLKGADRHLVVFCKRKDGLRCRVMKS